MEPTDYETRDAETTPPPRLKVLQFPHWGRERRSE